MRFTSASGVVASLTLLLIVCAKNQVRAAGGYCYEDPECDPSHWDGLCKTGKSQSPIDFNTTTFLSQMKTTKRLRFDAYYMKNYDKFYVVNNGHTVQIQLEDTPTSQCLVDGAGFKGSYVFAQMHFHWGRTSAYGSEHTVDGKHFPIEAHFVHFSDKYENLGAALQDNNRRAVAVLGIFFNVVPHDNPALKSIIDAIQLVPKPVQKPRLVEGKLNLTALLPMQLGLYRYEGSLTTPTCAEKVVWSVFRAPVGISEKQLEAFRALEDSHAKPMVNNYRPVQPLAKRGVKLFEIDGFEIKGDDEHNEIDDLDTEDGDSFTNPPTQGHGIDHESTEHSTGKKKTGERIKAGGSKVGGASILSLILLLSFSVHYLS